MRFMIMHKNDPHTEAGGLPSPEIIAKMGAFVGGYAQSGKLVDGAGLGASKTRTRLVFHDGQCVVKHGPYRGEHELPAATLQLNVRSREEAIGWAERYGKIIGDCELELGKVNEPWDLGIMPAPENPPLQLLLLERSEHVPRQRSAAQKGDLTRLKTEMSKAGVLVRSYQLKSSAEAKRLTFTNNDLRVLDGPFVESKELIGGFAVLDLSGMDEAVELCRPYAAILGGTLEIDVRGVDQDEAEST
jgi:hypothetical protein